MLLLFTLVSQLLFTQKHHLSHQQSHQLPGCSPPEPVALLGQSLSPVVLPKRKSSLWAGIKPCSTATD